MSVHSSSRAWHPALWTVAAGMAFALVALVAAPLARIQFSSVIDNHAGNATWLSLAGGVFLTGASLWWLLMVRPQRFSVWRGAITGILVALFCYPVVLILAEVFQRDWATLIDDSTIVARALNVLMLSALTLLTTGFAATLTMAGTGALIAWALVRLDPAAAELTGEPAGRHVGTLVGKLFRVIGGVVFAVVAVLIGGFVWLSLMPFSTQGLISTSSQAGPAPNYAGAMAAFDAVTAQEATLALDRRCHSKLLTHGQKTSRVVIFFHGLTNCPAQADALAPELFALGYNVYVPRLPGHGEADPLTLALAALTAEDLVSTANSSIALAHGLGDDVVVSGLSAGGTMAAWVAQYRGDVDQSLIISPFLGPYVVPPWATHAATNLLLLLPNMMVWWDAAEPVSAPEMSYAYPRFATRALAQIMRLGGVVAAGATHDGPASKNVAMLLNDADVTVSATLNEDLLAAWRARRPDIGLQVLPPEAALPHDVIDPNQPDANIGLVYPVVIDMITGTAAP